MRRRETGDCPPVEEGCAGGRRDVVIEVVHPVLNFSVVELVSLS